MNKYTNTILALFLSGVFLGCSSNNDTETKEEIETNTSTAPKEETTPAVQTEEQIMPQCYISEGTPKTESSVVVHVKCRNGNIHIDEATVTVDKKVKSVYYTGVGFNDYIGFKYLQPNTTYKAQLEVVVGGETITKSVKIRTKKEVVKVTSTPTPTSIVNHPPVWMKDKYYKTINQKGEEIGVKRNILDLDNVSSDQEDDKIKFSISNVDLSQFNLQIEGCYPLAYPYKPEDAFFIKNDILTISGEEFDLCLYGKVIVTVKAQAKDGMNSTKIRDKARKRVAQNLIKVRYYRV